MKNSELLALHYNEVKFLTEGSSGEIYKVIEEDTKEELVLKVSPLTTKPRKSLFKAEAKILKRLKHKNICHLRKTRKFGTSARKIGVFEFERCDIDLMAYMLGRKKMGRRKIKVIMKEICQGVAHCHLNGIAHMDLKPDNILLNFNGKEVVGVKVCDFGFARKMKSVSGFGRIISGFTGTREYSPPEILDVNDGEELVVSLEKIDVFSLGVTMFVMITGYFPRIFDDRGGLIGCQNLDCLRMFDNDKYSCELVKLMMCDDPFLRPTLLEVLNHPYFAP